MPYRRHHNNTGQAQVRAGKTRKQVADLARILQLEQRVAELEHENRQLREAVGKAASIAAMLL